MISEIFYTLFIWPIKFIFEFLFVLFIRIFDAPGFAVIFLSIVINTLLLPVYLTADRWQKEERDMQKLMSNKLKQIRSVFSGDERQMRISTYYREMGYSPVFIVKSSVGLLLQVPFFIAAYQFLSSTKLLTGVSFLWISDLNVPDALIRLPFSIFGLTVINLLPILMTVINILSSYIYTKDLGKRENIQLLSMSLLFLILLYRSPSGLVIYWTVNNLYSFVKNSVMAYLKKPALVLKITAILVAVVFLILIWTGKANVERYRMLFSGFAALLGIVPFVLPIIMKNFLIKSHEQIDDKRVIAENNKLFFSSIILLFLIIGVLNPIQVLLSSIEDFENPWYFMRNSVLQGLSFLILIPLFIRALSSSSSKRVLGIIFTFLAIIGVISYFALSASYGVMDRNFRLDDTNKLLYAFPIWINLVIPVFVIFIIFIIYKLKKMNILSYFLQAACGAIVLLSVINFITLNKGYVKITELKKTNNYIYTEEKKYFNISRTEKNVFIIFLDRAQGSAFLDIINFMPSFKKDLDGFTYYPNTISFGLSTVTGLPAMLGGYDYTPLMINNREKELLVDKVNSAILTLPKYFGENNYRVTMTDPIIANMQSVPDISIFKGIKNVNAELLSGKLLGKYIKEFNIVHGGNNSFDFDILFRYGIFRVSLPAFRYGIYYKGQWWREAAYNSFGRAIGEFSSLYYFSDICSIDNGKNTLNIFMNSITHEGGYYNQKFFPQETPVLYNNEEISLFGSAENVEYSYVLMSAIKQLIKWFEFLKSENIYDNTRIVIVSDHGGNYKNRKANSGMEPYNPLLMYKDFNDKGELEISEELMTNADTLFLAMKDLINTDINRDISFNVFSAISSLPLRHGPYKFNLVKKRELKGNEVLKKESWGNWEDL